MLTIHLEKLTKLVRDLASQATPSFFNVAREKSGRAWYVRDAWYQVPWYMVSKVTCVTSR